METSHAILSEEISKDEELVESVLAGHEEVFARLYQRYYSRTYRIACAMTGNRETAEDLTQDIFLRAYAKLGQFQGKSSFSTWFYRLTINLCLNYRQRSNKRTQELAPGDEDNWHSDRGEAAAAIFQQQIHNLVQKALLSLKPKLRMVVILKDVEGLSYEEIAVRMNCRAVTVGTRLNRARKLLARRLKDLR